MRCSLFYSKMEFKAIGALDIRKGGNLFNLSVAPCCSGYVVPCGSSSAADAEGHQHVSEREP